MNFITYITCLIFSVLFHFVEAAQEEYSNKQKTILVTGGAGFIGSHLCERLLQQGHRVICLDNLSSGSNRNIELLQKYPLFSFIRHDITIPLELNEPFDEIFNLACQASPPLYQKDPIHTFKTNVLGALFVLDLAKKTQAKVFQASTSEIYGDPLEHPQSESYWGNVNPIGIRSCYDEGKRAAETLFFDYWRKHGVQIKVGRIFNTYGPRMRKDDGRVITNFIDQALNHNSLTIYGNGEQTRSFCYISDMIDAIIAFMDTPAEVTGPINLGNPSEFTVLEVANKIIALTCSNSDIVFKPLPEDDPKKRNPNISLACSYLEWFPKISLEEGLKHTIASSLEE
jgi:UDP-glucuronate decarboxylase